jgi:aspartyl-tRNA(Asn)/glutamyl-tRNA(Gln) amidotransferase subunit A
MSRLPFDTLSASRDAVARREISSVELTRAVLARIEQYDAALQSFNAVFADRALDRAGAVDRGEVTGPLVGVPIAVKDNLCTRYGKTTCSSRILEHFEAPYDATVVRRLEEAGGIVIGKTNLDEFAMGSSTEHSAFRVTRNPWDATRVPGGSSGGSAAALAAGMCVGSLGSDTGGSVRQPAALCGLVGLKPTYGRVSRYGLVAYASSLDQVGCFGWTARDVAVLLGVIAGPDPKDSTCSPEPAPDYLPELEKPIRGTRIGIAREYSLGEGIDPQVRSAISAAVEVYRFLGVEVVDVSLPHTPYGIAAYYVIAPCEASSNLARYDGVHFGHRTRQPVSDVVELFSRSRAEGFGAEVQRRIMLGTYALSSGYYDAYYLRALKIRRLIKQDFDTAFERCDAVLCPTSPTPAFRVGEKSDDPLSMYLCDVFTVTANIAGIPGISVPCGFATASDTGKPLPIGLQLLGPAFGEPTLLRLAHAYQSQTDWHTRRPGV